MTRNLSGPPFPVFPKRGYQHVRAELLAGREIALLDVREEDPHAQAHPLFATNLPAGRIELDAYSKLPRRNVPIVVLDGGEGLAVVAAARLRQLGYSDVSLLDGGIDGWRAQGGELFRDVNVPSKAFGELVEARCHTPSLPAQEVQALIAAKADIVILDARRYEEYQTMSIPGGISVPGAELALRARALAPDPATRIIVNCAGRTRSIIGAQSLRNAGVPNPVAALRNGTIGWTLAGLTLEHGQSRRHGWSAGTAAKNTPANTPAGIQAEIQTDIQTETQAARAARALADRAGVQRTDLATLAAWRGDTSRSTYYFDVRSPEEFAAGRLEGFRNAPGGQLVQETEQFAPVRGARIVLADSDGVRANMSASWLRQMNHEVYVVDRLHISDFNVHAPWRAPLPELPIVEGISVHALSNWLADEPERTAVLDVSTGVAYQKRHIAGAWFALRSDLKAALARLPEGTRRYVLTYNRPGGDNATSKLDQDSGDSVDRALARLAAADLAALTALPVLVLDGGTQAWAAAGLPVESGATRLASPLIDRYRRPYEGTDNQHAAMQAYLDWEYGLIEQLERDGTHGFRVLGA